MANKRATASAALVLAVGFSCLSAQQPKPVFSSDAAAEHIPNLSTLKAELRQYHDCTCRCGCYTHDLDVQADRAIEFLHRVAARRKPNKRLALILDIDDTTLSTYQEMADADFGYNPETYDAWLAKAQAPAIPGTLRLYKEAQKLGVSVLFVTGRSDKLRAATERNLRAQGFGTWDLLVMRPAAHGSQTIGEFKQAARKQIVAAGYTLALNVGDQWSDLKGAPEAEYSVKYPDPYYLIP